LCYNPILMAIDTIGLESQTAIGAGSQDPAFFVRVELTALDDQQAGILGDAAVLQKGNTDPFTQREFQAALGRGVAELNAELAQVTADTETGDGAVSEDPLVQHNLALRLTGARDLAEDEAVAVLRRARRWGVVEHPGAAGRGLTFIFPFGSLVDAKVVAAEPAFEPALRLNVLTDVGPRPIELPLGKTALSVFAA
jgi:hypothetical protein